MWNTECNTCNLKLNEYIYVINSYEDTAEEILYLQMF